MKTKNNLFKAVSRVVATAIAFSLLAAGCGSAKPQAQPITLRFWKTFEDSQSMQPLFDAFRQKYPSVTIEYTKKNVENYEKDLVSALAAGNGPDIFSIHNSWLPAYMDKITPAPTSTLNYTQYKNDFVDVAVSDFTKNGSVYGVPLSVDSLALYYNKDLMGTKRLPTPPKTWDELSAYTRELTQRDQLGYFSVSGLAAGTTSNINRAVDILYLLMLQKGTVPYSQDGSQPTFTRSVSRNGAMSSPGADALTYYTSFSGPLSANYSWNSQSDYSIDAFANGRAAFMYSYSYTRATLLAKAPNLNYDVAPVPQPSLNQPSVNFANYWGEVVSKQSKNSVAAWEFLKFISSKDALDKYYAANKLPSSRRDLISLQIQDPEIGVFAAANLTAKAFYRPDQEAIDGIMTRSIDAVVLRGQQPEEALRVAEQQASVLGRQ